jgi:RNA polymerase sigma-70 factor (ECF subfamily)
MAAPDPPPPPEDPDHTGRLFDRYRAGDPDGLNRLLGHVYDRFGHLARQMLRRYPALRPHVETGDVLNQGMARLLDALRTVKPESLTHFLRLGAVQLRRELVDLARRFLGRAPGPADDPAAVLDRQPDPGGEPPTLAAWAEFHVKVGRLRDELRAVVDLHFYQGLTLEEVARQLGVSERTVKRRWRDAKLALGGMDPGEDPV